MKLLFIFGLLLTLLTSKSHATVGVITDILKVQSEALSKTANKNADLLAKNLEAQIVNLYELDDIPIYSQADNKMLLKTVDSIYEHELFASRSGLTSALSGISEFTSDINHIQDIYKNASILYKSAAGLTKLSKQAYKLVKIGGTPEKLKLRAKILSNLLEFGSGNRNAYYRLKSNYNNFLIDQSQFVEFGAYLANTLPLFESNLEDEKSPIKAVNAINGIIELMKGEVSNEVLENLRREEWAKLVIQDFVVGKWRDEGKSFSHMKAYVKDESCEGLLNFSACSVWGYSHTVADLYEADISDESVDLIYAFSNITTLSLLAKQPNTYVVELPEYILNHSEHGVPTSIKYNAYGDNVLTTYGAHISSELMVGESDNVKSFIIDLTNIESSLALDVQISYENKETLIGEDYLQYFTQLTSLSVSAISESPATEGLSVDIKACGGEIYNTSFYYKNTSQTNWQSTLLFLGDGISSDDGTCSTYSVDIDAWEVSRYTSSNKNINFYFAAANLTSTTQSVFLVNSSDTDNDGMHDESCENEFFGDLSRNANDDEDEDGVSNLNECNNRTDPTKAGNAGILSSVSIDTVAFSDGSTSCSLNDSYWSNVSIKCSLTLDHDVAISGDLDLKTNINLNGFNLTIDGNLIQSGGTVSATDGELLINGNVTQSGGTLNVLGGNISIGGDYRIQQLTDEPDVYTYGSGRLSMTVPNGHITINGNFYVDTAAGRAAFENPLTAGLFELKGDFTFLSTASYDNSFSNYGFYTSGTHKVLLSGDSEQKIYFDDINKSSFNVLEIVNDSIVIFDTSLVVKKLFNHNQLTFMLNNNSSFPDFDGDGYKDNVDTFPLDAERFQLDTDGDGLANNVDLDDDGDGIPDVWELTYGLEPTDASDADTDLDQDGLSNFEEFLAGTLPNNNDSDDDGIKDSDDSKPTVADNNSGISSLQLANYRDALLSPKEGDRLVQDQPFRVTWSTSQIGGNYVAMYVLHDNPEGIDVDSGFDVEVIKSRNWYKFAVDMPNNGDIGFDAGLLNGIGNTYKVLLISDSGEWTVHGGTFEINESESANNSTEIYSLDLTNYRDALLSPQQGDEFTQTQNFNVSWAANNILGDKVNLYVLQDNAIGIDTDAGFDVEEIKKHKWYNFAVDVANNGDISFDAALLKSIGNSHKVLLVADSGEWTMHEGTFTVGLAKLKFTAEWLQGKTLYNIYPDSDDGDNDGKIDDYGAVTFAFTNSTALYSEGLVDTVTGTSTDYIIDDNGFIISVLAENDGTHLIRLMSPIESDPLRLCWTTLNNEKKIDVNSALTDEVKNEITDSLMDEHCINSDEYFYIDKSAAEIKLLGIDDSNNGDDSEEPLLLDNYRDALLSPQKGSQLYVGQPFKVTWDASKFNTTTVSLYVLADSPDGIDIDDGFNMDLINDPNWYNFAVDVPNNGNIGFDANILKGTGDSYKILLRADSDEWTIHRGTFTVNKAIVDSDNDTVPDSIDNCSAIANSDQLNTDGTNDGGDACDSDDDNDGELDASDAFPLDSGESVDTDGDGIGNNADTDDDDDGILDDDDSAPLDNTVGDEQAPEFAAIIDVTIEATGENTTVMLIPPSATDNIINGLEVTSDHNNAPLAVGTHTITWTAKDLSGNASTVTQLVHVVDTTPPEFSVQASETINARGLLTNVASDINAVATDLVDGEVLAGIIGDTLYPSGIHNIQLLAKDISGNETQANIVIQVNPYVELGQNAEVEAGILYRVPVTLSGTAPVYPVKVSYQAVGAFSGSTSGELVINSGTSQSIELRISETALAGESVTLSLISANNAVLLNTQSVILTVTDVNLSPTVGLSVTQGDKPISLIDAKGGVVTVTVDDLNQADTHTITWSAGNSPFADLGNDGVDNTFEFAPLLLTSGTYDLSVKVTENNTAESFEVSVNTSLQVETALGELSNDTDTDNDGISDADEGYADTDNDGIADYLDDDDNPSRLPIGENIRPMQTINGLSLSLGDVARSANGMLSGSASIDVGDIAGADETNQPIMDNTVDSHFDTLSTIVNFNVSGLSSVGETVPVVIPLADNKFIPEGAVYRKYTVAAGWFNFVVNANNSVSSALKDSDGNCPTPLSAGYTVGLSVGDNCLQLLIEDGGANDADGLANGLVEDPGVLATEVPNNPPQISLPPSLSVKEKEILTIDASNTQDAEDDELTYSWKQLSGESVELDGQETEQLSFESPSVASDEVLTFELTVNDGRDTSIVTIDVMVGDVNEAPVISIEHTVTAFEENTEVSLSSNSTDADDDSLTYLWEQVSGPSANLNDATSSTISFTAPEVESEQTLEFKLTVSDGLAQAEATTSIQVKKASSSGGAMAWLILITLITIARKLNVVKLQRDL